jgi:hypothetical protein
LSGEGREGRGEKKGRKVYGTKYHAGEIDTQ